MDRPALDPTPCGICGCVIGAGLMLLHTQSAHPLLEPLTFSVGAADLEGSHGPTWAVCVNEWNGVEYVEVIVGPFDTEAEAEEWSEACPDSSSVFDLLPPGERRLSRG